jgi:putative tricarboxylic transport membrane protein
MSNLVEDGLADLPVEQLAKPVFPQPKTMRWPYRIAGVALLALGIFVGITAIKLRYYTSIGPGPGFFPFWLGIVLCILAVAMLAGTLIGKQEAPKGEFFASVAGYARVGSVIACLLAATFLLNWLGFCLTMLAIHFFLLYVVGRNRLVFSVIAALIGSFGIYYVFVHWLTVQLPPGILGI